MSRAQVDSRVAVLDDDQDVVTSIANVFRRVGLPTYEFTSKAILEAVARERRFDAYVLDWLLGEDTVLDLISALREIDGDDPRPIVLLSGNLAVGGIPSDEVLVSAIRRFGLIYRAKPYSALKLAKDLSTAMHGGSHGETLSPS